MTLRLTHLRLFVSDVQACQSFYRDIFGLEVLWEDEDGHYVSFKTGEIVLALNRREALAEALADKAGPSPFSVKTQDPLGLIFAVDDVDAAYQELTNQGIAFVTEPTDRPQWGIRTAHLRDPDGNLIEINHPLHA